MTCPMSRGALYIVEMSVNVQYGAKLYVVFSDSANYFNTFGIRLIKEMFYAC